MTKWLEIGEKYIGLTEDKRPGKSNPVILGWLQNEGGGKSWVKNDSTPWCGAAMAGIFTEAGLAHVIPKSPLVARSWLNTGVEIKEPRVGAIVVFPRGNDPKAGHVGLVKGFDASTIHVLGGNQSDQVNVKKFPRTGKGKPVGYRWPLPIKTPKELEEASRIAAAAARQQKDAAKGGASGSSIPVPVTDVGPPKSGVQQTIDNIFGDITWAKQTADNMLDFVGFLGAKWPWLAGAVALYFFARMAWDSHMIKTWRTEDANEGYTT